MSMPSIYKIAARVGCHYTTVSRMRQGVRRPSPELLLRMCDEFDWNKAEALEMWAKGRQICAEYIAEKLRQLPDEGGDELPE